MGLGPCERKRKSFNGKQHRLAEIDPPRLFFCRLTQLGLLRLLTAAAVMGPDQVKSPQEAWKAYDRWLEDERVEMLDELEGLEAHFRVFTRSAHRSPKDWADSYLAAFAQASRLTLATFDQAFQAKSKELHVLEAQRSPVPKPHVSKRRAEDRSRTRRTRHRAADRPLWPTADRTGAPTGQPSKGRGKLMVGA